MKAIIRNRDSGKAQELLQFAKENNAIILTQDKRAFSVKAESYGYNTVEIIDYDDLQHDNYDLTKSLVIHNGDKVLKWLFDRYYNIDVIGFTATLTEEK